MHDDNIIIIIIDRVCGAEINLKKSSVSFFSHDEIYDWLYYTYEYMYRVSNVISPGGGVLTENNVDPRPCAPPSTTAVI